MVAMSVRLVVDGGVQRRVSLRRVMNVFHVGLERQTVLDSLTRRSFATQVDFDAALESSSQHSGFALSDEERYYEVTFWHAYRDFFSNSKVVEQRHSSVEYLLQACASRTRFQVQAQLEIMAADCAMTTDYGRGLRTKGSDSHQGTSAEASRVPGTCQARSLVRRGPRRAAAALRRSDNISTVT